MKSQFTYPVDTASHLEPVVWEKVNRLLVKKAIAEFSHEGLLHPEPDGTRNEAEFSPYRLVVADKSVVYRFQAHVMAMNHWRILADSLSKSVDQAPMPLDALQFIIEIQDKLCIPEDRFPIYLDEIASTLHGAAYKYGRKALSSADLAGADYQTVETSMIEGHPCFIANNGRLGFNSYDYHIYAPEAAAPVKLLWLAVHKENAHFACLSDMNYPDLLRKELGGDCIQAWTEKMLSMDVDPVDYYFMPAHPWQWLNKLSITFSPYVANRRIICLGYSDDRYFAQQSIRTFYNISSPCKHYVKTSLSILNMGFMRGLSPYYMSGTPAINEYIYKLIDADPWLRSNGFAILREVASLGFRNYYYESAISGDTPYKKMFSALWRENPVNKISENQHLMTMAALLHIDAEGHALLPELIGMSGMPPDEWLRRYINVYLIPLVHCFYAHDLVFMPHGENVILVLENGVPVRAYMKDIAEESSILNPDAQLPENIVRLIADIPDSYKLLTIFVDVFEGFFRHLSQVLTDENLMQESGFWSLVASNIETYLREHPQRLDKYRRYDLFAPTMIHSCLNRLQLANNLQMVNLADPIGSFQMAPELANPIAPYRPSWLDSFTTPG